MTRLVCCTLVHNVIMLYSVVFIYFCSLPNLYVTLYLLPYALFSPFLRFRQRRRVTSSARSCSTTAARRYRARRMSTLTIYSWILWYVVVNMWRVWYMRLMCMLHLLMYTAIIVTQLFYMLSSYSHTTIRILTHTYCHHHLHYTLDYNLHTSYTIL